SAPEESCQKRRNRRAGSAPCANGARASATSCALANRRAGSCSSISAFSSGGPAATAAPAALASPKSEISTLPSEESSRFGRRRTRPPPDLLASLLRLLQQARERQHRRLHAQPPLQPVARRHREAHPVAARLLERLLRRLRGGLLLL